MTFRSTAKYALLLAMILVVAATFQDRVHAQSINDVNVLKTHPKKIKAPKTYHPKKTKKQKSRF